MLVRVRAASVNQWDRDQEARHSVLGADIAGLVEGVGKKVMRFRPGNEVFGDISGCGWGGFAEYAVAREDTLAQKPPGVTFADAAATSQAAVLALQGLRKSRIRRGQSVLINGAGGGVGTFAVQLAKSFGAEVTGVEQ